MSQPALLQFITKDVKLGPRASPNCLPVPFTKILQHALESKDFDDRFHYMFKLNYLVGLTQPDIQYAVHACVTFSVYPKQEHGDATENILRCLKGTQDVDIILHANKKDAFQVDAGADFSRN